MRHDRVQAAARRIDHPQIPATRRARPVENDVGPSGDQLGCRAETPGGVSATAAATVCRHGPERELATVGLSHERDLRAVRRVGGVGVDVGVIRQHQRRRPVRGHAHDLVVARCRRDDRDAPVHSSGHTRADRACQCELRDQTKNTVVTRSCGAYSHGGEYAGNVLSMPLDSEKYLPPIRCRRKAPAEM